MLGKYLAKKEEGMSSITKPVTRIIIEDFAKEIQAKKMQTAKPSKEIINFRNDIKDRVERDIWMVPIEILRYRKDNGRIASDVMDYEKSIGILDETDDQAQAQLADFLKQKDPEKTAILRKAIIHSGQLDAAIITCDGFLINGNRRKMVIEGLHKEFPEHDSYGYMKVVILPGEDEEGGPPTLLEIEKLENRYQLQSDGKSEYYGFDRALSIKRKISIGLSLEEQLRDDPAYAGATKAELKKAVKDYEKRYLAPLECVDRYLDQFGRQGQYKTISTGFSDREGRWQAFIDYSNTYSRYFSNPKQLIELGIEEDEIGRIEEAAFNIIRLRTIPDMPKLHVIMRDFNKYCRTKEGKKEILKITDEVDPLLPQAMRFDKNGNSLGPEEIDAKWAAKNKQSIIYHVKNAKGGHETKKEKETPLSLLEAAYKKLIHEDLDLTHLSISDWNKARKLAADISSRAVELEKLIYDFQKNYKKLQNKKL